MWRCAISFLIEVKTQKQGEHDAIDWGRNNQIVEAHAGPQGGFNWFSNKAMLIRRV